MPRKARPETERKRKAPVYKIQESRPIARSYAEASEADRKLIDLRQSGMSWPNIRRAIADFTGEELTAPSTLPNRYKRLMANFTSVAEVDNARLLEAKAEVDAHFEKTRWQQVAQAMITKGSGVYDPDVLQRQHRKLMMRAEHLAATGKDLGEDVSEVRMQADERAQAAEDLTTSDESEEAPADDAEMEDDGGEFYADEDDDPYEQDAEYEEDDEL